MSLDSDTLKTCVIVPAYNEARNIRQVIVDIRRHFPKIKIVVIDDGSGDETGAIVRSMGETVLRLPINLGIGGAVQTGLKYACNNDYDVAVQVDGDGQHLASELPKILQPVYDGAVDAVIGSRFLGSNHYPGSFFRMLGIRAIRLTNSLLVRQRITDSTSGFRAYNRRAMSFLARDYPQDYPEPEAVVTLIRNGYSVAEVAVVMRPRINGRSSIGLLNAAYYMIKVLLATVVASTRRSNPKEQN